MGTQRPRAIAQEASSTSYAFQLLDVKVQDRRPPSLEPFSRRDVVSANLMDTLSQSRTESGPNCVVFLFGCTEAGNSILVSVPDFRPSLLYRKTHSVQEHKARIARRLQVPTDRLTARVVLRKNAYGWAPNAASHPTDRQEFEYVEVFFPTVGMLRDAVKGTECHEGKIDVDTKFMDGVGLVASGWVVVKGHAPQERISHCAIEIEAPMRSLTPDPNAAIAPLVAASFDIECVSETNAFPDFAKPGDIIACIGLVLWRVGAPFDTVSRHLFIVGECAPIEDAQVMSYGTERDMLLGFRDFLVCDADPDVIMSYNGFGFDNEYLAERARLLDADAFWYCGRFVGSKATSTQKELSSSALGQNDLYLINMAGRSNLDLFHWVKAREKLNSYKLDDVAAHFVGDKKHEMDYVELFRMVVGTPKEKATVGSYCVQDCALLVKLAIRLQTFAANVEMSRVCHTSMENLVTRGQQIKVMNQLVWFGHRVGRRANGDGCYVVNTPDAFSGSSTDSYEGATVIDAQAGFYTKPVAVLDFMSLYPSIMLAHNFCFSTLVQDTSLMGIDGVEYKTIRINDDKVYTFATSMPGLLQVMLREILAARKQAKRLMAAAQSAEEKAVFDARQKALKVSANSIYGFTGAVKTGKYHCLAVADSVTYMARQMLHDTVAYVSDFSAEAEVIYGDTDSVMVIFPGCDTAEAAFAVGDAAAEAITLRFPEDVVLEMEKVYLPYLLFKKKRYAGLMYSKNKQNEIVVDYLDAKGIELVRRDNCEFAKGVYKGVLDALMYDRDVEKALASLARNMDRLKEDRVERSEFLLSKSLRKTYKSQDLAHLQVVRKMHERRPGSEPQPGERVPFVYIEPDDPKAKAFERAEDPAYASANALAIDRLYYLEHQIVSPITSLLKEVVPSTAGLFDEVTQALRRQQTSRREGCIVKFGGAAPAPPQTEAAPSSLSDMMMNISSAQPVPTRKRGAPKRQRA